MKTWKNQSRRHSPSGKMVIISSTMMFGSVKLDIHKMNYQAECQKWVVSCQLFTTNLGSSKLSVARVEAMLKLVRVLNNVVDDVTHTMNVKLFGYE